MKVKHSMRSPLGRVRGLGSAKYGAAAWWTMRVTAVALIPLGLWLMWQLVYCVQTGDHTAVQAWLHNPVSAGTMILFLLTGCHHGAAGIKEVIEDYVHCEASKIASLMLVKFGAAVLALMGTLAVLKIFLGAV